LEGFCIAGAHSGIAVCENTVDAARVLLLQLLKLAIELISRDFENQVCSLETEQSLDRRILEAPHVELSSRILMVTLPQILASSSSAICTALTN